MSTYIKLTQFDKNIQFNLNPDSIMYYYAKPHNPDSKKCTKIVLKTGDVLEVKESFKYIEDMLQLLFEKNE